MKLSSFSSKLQLHTRKVKSTVESELQSPTGIGNLPTGIGCIALIDPVGVDIEKIVNSYAYLPLAAQRIPCGQVRYRFSLKYLTSVP